MVDPVGSNLKIRLQHSKAHSRCSSLQVTAAHHCQGPFTGPLSIPEISVASWLLRTIPTAPLLLLLSFAVRLGRWLCDERQNSLLKANHGEEVVLQEYELVLVLTSDINELFPELDHLLLASRAQVLTLTQVCKHDLKGRRLEVSGCAIIAPSWHGLKVVLHDKVAT